MTLSQQFDQSADHATSALALYEALRARAADDAPLRTALQKLDGALRLYTPRNLAVAFNGGKDATVVMHLARAAVANWARENNCADSVLHCLYLLPEDGRQEFDRVQRFVQQQVTACSLDVVEVRAGFQEGIRMFNSRQKGTCAFVLGTRRDDPHGKTMEHFEPSTPGWPPFMRVNPILTWDYHTVWAFLRHFNLPYCDMYDHGYTSIGSVDTTVPNPSLAVHAPDGTVSYKPAWQLIDARQERAGRIAKPKHSDDRDSENKANGSHE